MRIGLVNGNPEWGGGEQWFWDASQALATRGHELVLAAQSGTKLFERYCGSGSPTFDVDDLREGFFEAGSDVILCNSGKDLRRVLKAAGGNTRAALVMRRGIDRPLRDNFIRRRSWRALSAILVNSDATGRTIRQSLSWFPEERIERVYNPVSMPVEPHVESDDGSSFRIGAVGRLVKQKGFEYLIQAVSKLPENLDWTLEFAGDGKLRDDLESLAEKLGVKKRCHFLGHVESLASFYARMDTIAIPSLYEGFCFVAVEAALAGLPVVASDTSSLSELVIHGETGLFVPPREVEPLSKAIQQLAEDRPSAARMGETAKRSAAERFNPDDLQDELSEFLIRAAKLPAVGKSS
jgi:glycosyltransferase involved in cell wall biosynthesis